MHFPETTQRVNKNSLLEKKSNSLWFSQVKLKSNLTSELQTSKNSVFFMIKTSNKKGLLPHTR